MSSEQYIKDNKIISFQFKEIPIDSYTSPNELNNTFVVFRTKDNLLYLVFSDINKNIIFFDLISNKTVCTIKKAHKDYITNFRYFLDKKNFRDLLLSISADDRNIKLWNSNTYECILNIEKIYSKGQIYSACFLEDDTQIFIIVSHYSSFISPEAIKVYDLNGNKIKELNDSKISTNFIDCFYDKKLAKNFLIRGKNDNLNSYDYKENKIYKDYYDEDTSLLNNRFIHFVINLKKKEKESDANDVELIASHYDSNIRIWNFHSGELIKKIRIGINLGGICLWKNKYLFSVCKNGTIKFVDLENVKIIQNLDAQPGQIINIEKINHPVYGTCLITQNLGNNKIKFWINQ